MFLSHCMVNLYEFSYPERHSLNTQNVFYLFIFFFIGALTCTNVCCPHSQTTNYTLMPPRAICVGSALTLPHRVVPFSDWLIHLDRHKLDPVLAASFLPARPDACMMQSVKRCQCPVSASIPPPPSPAPFPKDHKGI